MDEELRHFFEHIFRGIYPSIPPLLSNLLEDAKDMIEELEALQVQAMAASEDNTMEYLYRQAAINAFYRYLHNIDYSN